MHYETQIQAPQQALEKKINLTVNDLDNTRKGSRDRQTAIQLSPKAPLCNLFTMTGWLNETVIEKQTMADSQLAELDKAQA